MKALVEACLRLRVVVLLGAVLFLVVGARAAMNARIDVFPEFSPPRVEIQTEAPGLSALEVETLVTTPIERAVHGVAFVSKLRSKSVIGLSSVLLVFDDGTDIMQARQLVQERLANLTGQLPASAKTPVMLAPLSSTSRVLKIGVSSATRSQIDLSDLARFTIRPRLMAVHGVANVAIWGQRNRQFQILVDPDALQARGVRLDQVLKAAGDASMPAPAGYVDTSNQRFAVVHTTFAESKESLGETVVASRPGGASIRLADVASIVEQSPAPIGDAIIDGEPGLLLIVEKQPWGNTLDVTRGVERALDALRPGLTDVHLDPTIFRPATFIERAITNLGHAVAIGCVLVVVILFAFLFDWRTAVISVVAIPLSLVAAAATLAWRGLTLDTMAIAGLVIALGEVVDDAIIDVENIERRLAENSRRETPRPAFVVVLEASLEVRSAVVYATLVVLLVFVPIYFLEGLSGAFFRPLAVSYVLAVGASLLVALIVTPALSLVLLSRAARAARAGGGRHRGPLAHLVQQAYAPILERVIRRPRFAAGSVLVVLASAVTLVPWLGESFLPDFHETDFLMHWIGKPGTSVAEMDRITARVAKELRTIPGVRNFGSHIGRAEVADEVVGQNFAELWISLDEKANYAESVSNIRRVVDGYPGLYRDVQTYLQERMKEVLTGTSGSIVVRIYGSDLSTLRERAEAVGKALAPIPGVANLEVEPQVLVPQIEIGLDPGALARLGLGPGDVRRTVATYLQGTRVGEAYRGDQVIDVVVWGDASLRNDVSSVRELRIPLPTPTPSGTNSEVRLGDVASVEIAAAPNVVQRESASRRIDVTCDARGRDLGSVVADVKSAVDKLPFPSGHHAEILGELASRTAARNRLLGLSLLAALGIGLVLYSDFRSGRITFFLLGTLPFALVGGVIAVLFTGGIVSLGSLVGFVTVLGIAARNGIMMVSHFRHLEIEEGMPFGQALVVRGAIERVVPITMTALATGLALVPLIVAGGKPGSEIEHPMAVVILGGLVTSTILNLLLVPPLYLRFGRSAVVSEPA
ncbi:Cobalt-zinc-cadmium resistance protein CzcA [Labilithrix luteola]|uniref:Cobalt-zinc-cadmium resistance protein CzcA n=1 Tax=Labilithrix luteola TaxID=1391654 RepID=A0A0K1PX97_9BACT|nr:efflux RND transporter permease subunit [Labilithrix luteola]AKU97749.1 Cobalt-zinc-cadmium resistance protein CzcA [Labilithrix luteola]